MLGFEHVTADGVLGRQQLAESDIARYPREPNLIQIAEHYRP